MIPFAWWAESASRTEDELEFEDTFRMDAARVSIPIAQVNLWGDSPGLSMLRSSTVGGAPPASAARTLRIIMAEDYQWNFYTTNLPDQVNPFADAVQMATTRVSVKVQPPAKVESRSIAFPMSESWAWLEELRLVQEASGDSLGIAAARSAVKGSPRSVSDSKAAAMSLSETWVQSGNIEPLTLFAPDITTQVITGTVVASGGVPPYLYSLVSPPDGISIDRDTGELSGLFPADYEDAYIARVHDTQNNGSNFVTFQADINTGGLI